MKGVSSRTRIYLKRTWQLYLMLLPAVAFVALFHYGPLYGLVIAFKKYFPPRGYWGSPWVGLQNFQRFFQSPNAWKYIANTLTLSLYSLLVSFPFPIILSLCLHYTPSKRYQRTVQTVLYAPHFISTVVIVGMINIFFSSTNGLVTRLIEMFTGQRMNILGSAAAFPSLYVWSGIWQNAGWGTVIYMAALSGVDPALHESAVVDGANVVQRMWNIDLPTILPTIVILLIMECGKLMSVGYEKTYLMQNALNLDTSEIISTYVYKQGLINRDYSYSTAVGLFNSVTNCILLLTVNRISKAVGQTSLW